MWTIAAIVEATGGIPSAAARPDITVSNFRIIAYSCNRRSCFVPLSYPPLTASGNGMVKSAINSRGAKVALVQSEDGLSPDLPYILVPDLVAAIDALAKKARGSFAGKMIGVTGTAGKSSVKTMLGHVLKSAGRCWVTTSNQNLTPHVFANLASIEKSTDYAVMEIALLRPDTVEMSSRITQPNIGVITSIGLNHASAFEDPWTGIIESKTDLLRNIQPGGTVILPEYSARFDELLRAAKAVEAVERIIVCGYSVNADVQLADLSRIGEQQTATVKTAKGTVRFMVPYLGQHMVENATLVAGVLLALGLPLTLLKTLETAPRSHSTPIRYRVQLPRKVVELIDDSFNTGPTAISAIVKHASQRSAKAKYLVISDIRGVDGENARIHESLATEIDAAGFEHVFTVGPMMAKMAERLSTRSSSFANRFRAADALIEIVQHGSLVVVKGSVAMKFKDLINHIGKRSQMTRVQSSWVIEQEE